MNLSSQDSKHSGSQDSKDSKTSFIFSCKANNSEYFTTILSVLQMEKEKQRAVFMVTEGGIKATVEKNKVLQASAYMKSSIFQEYKLSGGTEEDRVFNVDLGIFLDCLRVFGDASHIQLSYGGYGEDIIMILENQGVITECSIRTQEGPPPTDFSFRSATLLNQASLKSKFLRDCLLEIGDVQGSEGVRVVMGPSAPNLSFTAEGNGVTCKVEFPNNDSTDVFEHFQCQQYASNTYNMSLIRMCAKSMSKMPKTDTTMIQMNAKGMLKLQHAIRGKNGGTNFISYLISPNEEKFEEDDVGDQDDYQLDNYTLSIGNDTGGVNTQYGSQSASLMST